MSSIDENSFDITQNVKNIIEEAKIKFKDKLNETKVKLTINDDVKQIKKISLSKNNFSRIVSNLINNAFEAKDSSDFIITIDLLVEDSFLVVFIKDNGLGVNRSKFSKIFDQGYSSKDSNRGYGLSHAKTQIEQAGGRLNVKNENGFKIEIYLEILQADDQ